ncbi:hypothetical protein OESDEN_08639 [Oesophagostomum dentatum]|uniref:Uncharacterized protein n=1 Tax=Oesophagostomum dentatum TaxID=61180 RepID=A0A0B1T7Y5_OESDE|nr:hypothetical protein OESDEN_08639 [Oesophagostomum dentatum]
MRPSSARQIGGSAKEFAEERDAHKSLDPTRDERVNRTRRSYRSTTSTETVESRPWGKCASECESSLEVTVNIDCIVVYREMDGSHPKFYVIFSKTHKFGILCDGGINLEVGKWARLRYIGKQLQPGQYLSSKSLCLICYIAPPSLVDVKRYKMTQLPDEEATYIVILTLRAEIECTEDGNLAIQSNVVGSIKVDSEWSPSTRIPRSFPKGAVIEIEFVRDSWFLRKLHGPWNDGFDFRKLDSPYIIPGYTVEEAEYNGRRHPHGMEKYRERTASTHRLAYEPLRDISPYPTNSRQNRDRSGFPDNNHTGRYYDEHYTRVPTANNHVSPANYLAENDILPRASDRTEGVMKQREDPFRDRHEIPSEASDGVERVMKQREDPFRERHEIIWKASDGMDEAMKQGKHPFSDRHFRSYSFKPPEERSSTKLIHDDLYYDIGREGDLLLQENVEDFDIPLDDLELSSNPRCSPMKEPPKQWVPPLMSPNREVIVDLDNEKPSGKNGRCAWCCAVQIRKDYLICYTPVEDIDKILIPASVIE